MVFDVVQCLTMQGPKHNLKNLELYSEFEGKLKELVLHKTFWKSWSEAWQ